MPEWWTYSLSDFLLFSPRTYYRLIERHNTAVWPVQLVALALGIAVAALLRSPSPARGRAVAGILAVVWGWVGWSFVARRYATINWAASYLAWLFAAEVLLLGWLGVAAGRLRFGWRGDAAALLGGALVTASLALYPLVAPAVGRGWAQAEVFGIMPDPTAIATVGLLLTSQGPPGSRWALMAAPLLWCALSGATLLAMRSPEAWLVLSALGVAIAAAAARGRRGS
jgi:Family of unknown function (DUF6064)